MVLRKVIIFHLFLASSVLFGNSLLASDFVIISAPAVSSTVSGEPLVIMGSSSQVSFRVRLTINTTEIGSATTDGVGDWLFTLPDLINGNYTIVADLLTDEFDLLATTSSSFVVHNAETISITSPIDGDVLSVSSLMVTGQASLASADVQLLVDSSLVTTTTTNATGYWQAAYTLSSNNVHTLLAQLLVAGIPVATSSVDVEAAIPIIFPSGLSQLIVIDGNAPTTGSGSGQGYTYSVSGSIMTINFSSAFATVPSIVATGLRSSGSSTVTLASVSSSAVNISFSAGTQKIHFTATAFA